MTFDEQLCSDKSSASRTGSRPYSDGRLASVLSAGVVKTKESGGITVDGHVTLSTHQFSKINSTQIQ